MEKKPETALSEAGAKAREERLQAMGVTVEQSTISTVTLLATETTEDFDEFAPERDDDGTGVDE